MSSESLPRILVDVTQYVRAPATAGIQRVLLRLAQDWQGDAVDARFGFLEVRPHFRGRRFVPALRNACYVTGSIADLGSVMLSVFTSPNTGLTVSSDAVRAPLRAAATQSVSIRDIGKAFDAYLLPEPTLQADSAEVARTVSARTPSFFVYYDALPLTHPQYFEARFAETLLPFHRALLSSSNIAFISHATRRTFEERLARRKVSNGIVAKPGADGLAPMYARKPERATFATVGSVEPRKGHAIVLDAFEQLWSAGRDYELVVMGAPGWEQPDLIERLRALTHSGRVRWIEKPADDDIAKALSSSSAVLYVPHAEGYGLPPLEALAVRCPAIVPADLPSLEDLPSAGQIRLSSVTAETVAAAVETLAAPDSNGQYRRAIDGLRLPTWREFASSIEQWVARALARPQDRSIDRSLA